MSRDDETDETKVGQSQKLSPSPTAFLRNSIRARILSHGVPHWDLENGHFGFSLSFMLFGYSNAALMLIIGPVEAAVRLPFLAYLLACHVLMLRMASSESHDSASRERLLGAVSLALFSPFLALLNGYHATYDPYLADSTKSTPKDLLMSTLFPGDFQL